MEERKILKEMQVTMPNTLYEELCEGVRQERNNELHDWDDVRGELIYEALYGKDN